MQTSKWSMTAFAVNARSREAHHAEDFALTNRLSGLDRNGREVGIERVVRAAVPKVLDNDVSPVVRRARVLADVDDVAAGGNSHLIAWVTLRVAADGTDVNSLMKLKVQDLAAISNRSAHKTELSALPRLGSRALKVAVYMHEEVAWATLEQSAIIGGEVKQRLRAQDFEGEKAEPCDAG